MPNCRPTSTRRPAPTATPSTPGRPRWPGSGSPPPRAAATRTTCGRSATTSRPARTGGWANAPSRPPTSPRSPTRSRRAVPSSAYSYTFEGQAQTLDHVFVNGPLHDDLVQVRAAHVNADWPADFPGDGPRGLSDHDPQVARFATRPGVSVDDVTVVEGDRGTTPATFTVSLTRARTVATSVCLVPFGQTATVGRDLEFAVPCGTIPAGGTSVALAIAVRGDHQREPDETFGVVAVPSGGTRAIDLTGTGTIVDDD